MKRTVLAITISLSAAAFLSSPVMGWNYNPELFTLATQGGNSMSTRIDGNFVIWTDMTGMKMMGYDLAKGESFTITSGTVMVMLSNESYVVWDDATAMQRYGFELATRRKFVLPIGIIDPMASRLTGQYLVYIEMVADPTLRGMDLKSGEIFDINTGDIDSWSVRAEGDYVVWRTMTVPAVLLGFQLSTRQGFLLSDSEMLDTMGLAMSDRFVVWREGIAATPEAGLYGFDLAKRERFLIADEDIDPISLRAAGQYIVGRAMTNSGLYGYDGIQREIFEIAPNADGMSLQVNEGYALWKDTLNMHWYGFDLAARRLIETDMESMYAPALGKSIFFWTINNPASMINELRGFDLATGSSFTVAPMSGPAPMSPVADGDYVVWTDMIQPSPDTGLFGSRIWKLPNDLCIDAVEMEVNEPYTGDSSGAIGTVQTYCGVNDWRDVWFAFKPMSGGDYTIEAHSDAFDTTLAAFATCTGTPTMCNDDANLQTTDSQLVMTLVKGKRYLFRMAGYDGSGGPYTFTASRGNCKTPPTADLTGDCLVNLADLAEFSSQWLQCGLDPVALCAP